MTQPNVPDSAREPVVIKTGTAAGEQAERARIRERIQKIWEANKDGIG